MNFLIKKFSKKVLSIVCAIAILISVVSIAFSTLANTEDAVDPYTVRLSSPAIPMTSLTKIDLNNIDVEFTEGNITDGTNIDWAIEEKSGISLDGTSLSVLKKGVYKVYATPKNGSSAQKTLYAVVKEEADLTWDIYSIDFTQNDDDYKNLGYVNSADNASDYITYNGAKISDSNPGPAFPANWQAYYAANIHSPGKNVIVHKIPHVMPYTNAKGTELAEKSGIMPLGEVKDLGYPDTNQRTGHSGYFVLNNEIVNAFKDYTISTDIKFYVFSTGASPIGLFGRAATDANGDIKIDGSTTLESVVFDPGYYHSQYDSGTSSSTDKPAKVYKFKNTNNPDTIKTEELVSGSDSASNNLWDYGKSIKHSNYVNKKSGYSASLAMKFNGDKAEFYSPLDSAKETYTIDSTSKSGVVGVAMANLTDWNGDDSSWLNVQNFKVSLNNDPSDPSQYPAYQELQASLYTVEAANPALPMYAGSYVETKDFVIEKSATEVYLGNELTYENKTGGNGIYIDNAAGRITAYTKGSYVVEAKLGGTVVATIYVVVKNKGDATWDLYSIDFTENDDDYQNLGYVNSDDNVSDYITYNGEKISASNPGPAFPANWQAYYAANIKSSMEVKLHKIPHVMPYTNAKGTPLNINGDENQVINTGIMPLADVEDLGYADSEKDGGYGQSGYFVLNNEMVNAFKDYTISTNINFYIFQNGASKIGLFGRAASDANGDIKIDDSTSLESVVFDPGYYHSHYSTGHTDNPALVYKFTNTNNPSTKSDEKLVSNSDSDSNNLWDYGKSIYHSYHVNKTSGYSASLAMKFDGDTAEFYSPLDPNGEKYTIPSVHQNGVVGITMTNLNDWNQDDSSWLNVQNFTVSLNNKDGECPAYKEFAQFITNESPYIYGTVGDEITIADVVVQIGDEYITGNNAEWKSSDSDKVSVEGGKISLKEKGVYAITAEKGGKSLTIMVAVKGAGEAYFTNGNYEIVYDPNTGFVQSYKLLDPTAPYTQVIDFPDRFDHADGSWTNIYEIGSLAAASGKYNAMVEKVTFGKYIEKIGNSAFANAINLKEVVLNERLTAIGDSAFENASSLKTIEISPRVDSIGANAFKGTALEHIYINNPDITIGDNALPAGVTIHGAASSKLEDWALENGFNFVALSANDAKEAADNRAAILEIEANRINTVDTKVKWIITDDNGGDWGHYLVGFIAGDRDAGKYVIPRELDYVNANGETVKASINFLSGNVFGNKNDTRAVLCVEIPAGMGLFGKNLAGAFNLQKVSLPNTMAAIPNGTFSGCTSLESIDIPASVEQIGANAFDGCTSLKEINIPEDSNLRIIGHNEFTNDAPLGTDPPQTFIKDTLVESIKLPVTLGKISNVTFDNTSIKEVYVYNKNMEFVDSNGTGVFFPHGTIIYGVKNSTAQALVNQDKAYKNDPENASKYRALVFKEIDDFFATNADKVDENAEFTASVATDKNGVNYYVISGYKGIGGKVIIPSCTDADDGNKNVPIYAIGTSAFQDAQKFFKSVLSRFIKLEISEGIAVIEESAFEDAPNLISVKFPKSLKEIGKNAFKGAALKGELIIPENVIKIGAASFANTGVTDVYIYNKNATILPNSFPRTAKIHGVAGSTAQEYAETNKMEFIAIDAPAGETIADIEDNGNYIFTMEGSTITGYERKDDSKPFSRKIVIPAKINGKAVGSIKEGVFENGAEASSVYAVVISEGIVNIDDNAFRNLIKLTHIEIPSSIRKIGDNAFRDAALTGDITLSENVASVGGNAFRGCTGISSITVLNKNCVLKQACMPGGAGFTLIGYWESTAREYAEKSNLKFVSLDGVPDDGESVPGTPEPETQQPETQEPETQEPETQEPETQEPEAQEPETPNPDDGSTLLPEDNKQPEKENNDKDNNRGDRIDPDNVHEDEDKDKDQDIVKVIRQSNLKIVIIIAIAVLLLVLLLGIAVVVFVMIKAKNQMEDQEEAL